MHGLIMIGIYVVVGVAVIVLGVVLYARAVASRRRYCCPQCGEQQTVELMDAAHCNICGAPLRDPMTGESR